MTDILSYFFLLATITALAFILLPLFKFLTSYAQASGWIYAVKNNLFNANKDQNNGKTKKKTKE